MAEANISSEQILVLDQKDSILLAKIRAASILLPNCQAVERKLEHLENNLPPDIAQVLGADKIRMTRDTHQATRELEDYIDGSIFQKIDDQ